MSVIDRLHTVKRMNENEERMDAFRMRDLS